MRKYVIVTGDSINELTSKVNTYIEDGYLPLGGVSMMYKEGTTYLDGYCQAMVSRELMI
jgi:uncharacterized protein DUF1737